MTSSTRPINGGEMPPNIIIRKKTGMAANRTHRISSSEPVELAPDEFPG